MFISIFLYLFVVTKVNHTLYWVKIQERNNTEIFKIWPIFLSKYRFFIFLSQIFQEAAPYFTETPQHRGLVILLRSSLVVQIYCILLYYCIFFIRIFFSRFTAIFWSKVFSYTLLGWVTMSNNHIYWVSSTYFFLLFSYKYCIERHD